MHPFTFSSYGYNRNLRYMSVAEIHLSVAAHKEGGGGQEKSSKWRGLLLFTYLFIFKQLHLFFRVII